MGDRFCTSCGLPLAPPPAGRRGRRPIWIAVLGVLVLTVAAGVGAALVLNAEDGGVASRSESPTAGDATPSPTPRQPAADLGDAFGHALDHRPTPCGIGGLTCTVLTVPADHTRTGRGTLEVRFGFRPAGSRDDRLGTLVVASGGPGTSAIFLSEIYLGMFPEEVLERYDVVFVEPRGTGLSSPVTCPEASVDAPDWTDLGLAAEARVNQAAQRWVQACLREAQMEEVWWLDAYGSGQAAADLDAYLDLIGAGPVTIYADSYGTVLAQLYAAHRPERVAALVLDGAIDPEVSPIAAAVQQVDAFGTVLDDVLASCDDDPFCVDDFAPATARETWDDFAAVLREGPMEVSISTSRGAASTIELTLHDLVSVSGALVYTEPDRSALLRLLAAAAHDDLAPLARTAALGSGLDPETGAALESLPVDDGAYFAIGCQVYDPTSQLGTARAIYDSIAASTSRLAGLAYSELACAYGFSGMDADPNDVDGLERLTAPVLVLGATADPATPLRWGERVAERLQAAHLVVTEGGPHGTFGRGSRCIDDKVEDLLLLAELPSGERSTCPGILTDWYVPILRPWSAYADAADALVALEEELWNLPDYIAWDGTPRTIGCRYAGTLSMSWLGSDRFKLDDCELVDGFPIDGDVTFALDGTTRMVLQLPNGEVEYESDPSWALTISGTIDGETIDIRR
ncbi:MAG TPA: alpha/beta hydrolase [Candidatus Limnocylindria bacterium]|nr:alpha/beta hydrolase [Candidatus Limnocylindria bacterium]